MSKKIFLFSLTLTFLVTGVFLFFNIVKSAAVPPEENTLCWLKKDCLAERKKNGWSGDGFVIDENTCPGYAVEGDEDSKWGKCLPGVITVSQISFAGKKEFANIGDYIKTVYNYSLIILSILASIMIIVAGIQYISSAGSQEMISSAKKKITGALIGLALAYMSYIILNMINPATINLRLPQAYMIRPEILVVQEGDFCDARPNTPTALACEAQSKGNVRYYCTPIGVDPEQCGIVDLRTCPCSSVAEFIGHAVTTLMTIGPGTLISAAEAVAGAATKVSMQAVKQSLSVGLKKMFIPKKFLTEPSIKAAFKKEYIEIIKGELKNVGPGEFERVADQVINKGIVVPTLKIGGQYALHAGKIAGATYVASYPVDWTKDAAAWAWKKLAESKEIRPGICSKNTLPEGSLCDMEKDLCATGKCIDFPGLGGQQCWTGNSKIGVCSSGKVNSFCNSNSDCANGNKCVAFASIGSIFGLGGNQIKACTDGSFGSPCETDDDCIITKQCGTKHYCVTGGGINVEEGGLCKLNDECYPGLSCFTSALVNVSYDPGTGQLDYSCDYKIIDKPFLKSQVATQNTGEWTLFEPETFLWGICSSDKSKISQYKDKVKSVWRTNAENISGMDLTCPEN